MLLTLAGETVRHATELAKEDACLSKPSRSQNRVDVWVGGTHVEVCAHMYCKHSSSPDRTPPPKKSKKKNRSSQPSNLPSEDIPGITPSRRGGQLIRRPVIPHVFSKEGPF